MLISQKYEFFVLGEEPISMTAIAKARYGFKGKYAKNPTTLRLDGEAYATICKDAERIWLDMKTIQGLDIVPDATLGTGEWKVGISEEKVTTE